MSPPFSGHFSHLPHLGTLSKTPLSSSYAGEELVGTLLVAQYRFPLVALALVSLLYLFAPLVKCAHFLV